ncbi:MAG: hypothetical protein M0R50_09145 [Candidatus Cloacimonetes bacterium]|jgi:hypothetical protein|nr:hypothetical protein [Candidatus Cloacimonadota bacterium]
MGIHTRKSEQCTFFTIPEIAEKLINEVGDLSRFKLIIEPSAGDGAFSTQIDGCKAYDIYPRHHSIIEADFLQMHYTGDVDRRNILCIGNPPFGPNGSLALAFIKKCCEFADTIAFILPLSYKKESMQERVPRNYHLIKQIDVPLENALLEGKVQKVPVVFQIWENKYEPRPKPDRFAPVGFSYVANIVRANADFCVRRVGMYAGKASRKLSQSATSHYYINLFHDDVDDVVRRLNSVKWEHNNTVGQRSISKNELNKVMLSLLVNDFNDYLKAYSGSKSNEDVYAMFAGIEGLNEGEMAALPGDF